MQFKLFSHAPNVGQKGVAFNGRIDDRNNAFKQDSDIRLRRPLETVAEEECLLSVHASSDGFRSRSRSAIRCM